MEKFKQKLEKWQKLQLSNGGRLTLTQLVLNSLPNYYLSPLKAPAGVTKDMDKIVRDFFWKGDSSSKCKTLVNWGETYLSLKMGRVGHWWLYQRNNACFSKGYGGLPKRKMPERLF